MKKRILSVTLVLALCLSLLPAPALAAENGGTCPHHTEHTKDCGYIAPTEGQSCTHVHDASCGFAEAADEIPCDKNCEDADGDGVIDHAPDCAYRPGVEARPCAHAHGEDCGYAEAAEGSPCTYVCLICPVQALIDALPADVTAENAADVRAQLAAVGEAKAPLTDEQLAQLDTAPCDAAASALAALETPDTPQSPADPEGPLKAPGSPETPEAPETPEVPANALQPLAGGDTGPFTVTGGALGTDYAYRYIEESGSGELIVTGSTPLTISGGTETDRIIVGGSVSITLENLSVDLSGITARNAVPLEIMSESEANAIQVTVILKGSNALKAGGDYPGLQVVNAGLTITGDGSLEAWGSEGGRAASPGIRAGLNSSITISGGSVTANGAHDAAGIGGGLGENGGNITIKGGSVTANGGGGGAGIGGGFGGESGSITISGGTVTANGGENGGAGIGGGSGGDARGISISGGTVTANGGPGAAGVGGGSSVEYNGSTVGGAGEVSISGGTVTANGGENGGAGIGGGIGGAGSVTIEDGFVTANGGGGGAGVGGGAGRTQSASAASRIIIKGGTVEAYGGENGGAGVGGGNVGGGIGGNGGVTIEGGSVKAYGGSNAAGIGGGSLGGGTVTIYGGTVEAYGGDCMGGVAGAIGSGRRNAMGGSSANSVSISGGVVKAVAGQNGVGIGGGSSSTFQAIAPGGFIVASSITDTTQESSGWRGVIFNGTEGKVYASRNATYTLPADAEIPEGHTLTSTLYVTLKIPEGVTLTNNGNLNAEGDLSIDGTLVNNGPLNVKSWLYIYGALVNNGALSLEKHGSLIGLDGAGTLDGDGTFRTANPESGAVYVPPLDCTGDDLSERIRDLVKIMIGGKAFDYYEQDGALSVERRTEQDYIITFTTLDTSGEVAETSTVVFSASLPEGEYTATVEASGGTTPYASLEEAWNAANESTGSTLTLLKSRYIGKSLEVSESADFTLKMADGVTLGGGSGGEGCLIAVYGKLTAENCTICLDRDECLSIFGGAVVVKNCEFSSGTSGIGVIELTDGHLAVHSGTFTGTEGTNGLLMWGGTAELRGGTFIGEETSWGGEPGSAILIGRGPALDELLAEGYAYRHTPPGGGVSWPSREELSQTPELLGTVEVLPVPVTVTGPEDAAVTYGYAEAPELTVKAEASALPETLGYAWRHETPDGRALELTTGEPSLTLPYGLTVGTHRFVCTVTWNGFQAGEYSADVTVNKAPLAVAGVTAENKTYDGVSTVKITGAALTGVVNGEDVTASGSGKVAGADAGTYTSVTPFMLTLGGRAKENYTLEGPFAEAPATVTIAKAPAPEAGRGSMTVQNGWAKDYTYDLKQLLPALGRGKSFGEVEYKLDGVNTTEAGYYDGQSASVSGSTLTLPIQAVESQTEGTIGTVRVTASSTNYEDMTAEITVKRTNKLIPEGTPSAGSITYGQTVGEAALSGAMRYSGAAVAGTFAWDAPDAKPHAGTYSAAWTFTPADGETYAAVHGAAEITVNPADIANAEVKLSPKSFRHNGAAHSPESVSVELDGVVLKEGIDYTLTVPAGTEPGPYTVEAAGKGNYAGTASARFTINEVLTEDLVQKDGSGNDLRLEVETGLSSVPAELAANTAYKTPESIENALRVQIEKDIVNVGEHLVVYDVALQYWDPASSMWKEVDPLNFPLEGVTAILPYPEGTGAAGYRFEVRHMISSISNGMDAGKLGTIEELEYTLTKDGLQCTFHSLSPVAIGYQAVRSGGGGNSYAGAAAAACAVTVEKAGGGKVTSSHINAAGGTTVTLTVVPDSGYALDMLTVTDSQGNGVKLTAKSGGQYTFTMPVKAVTVKAVFAPLPDDAETPCDGGADCPSRGFTDLGTVGAWYHEAVDYVLRNGLMNGYKNGLFGPDRNLSRAQFAQILYNIEGRPAVAGGSAFRDVADGAWCAGAITWANKKGIVGGYGGGTFGPDDSVTREQFAVMLWRYAQAKGRDVSVGEDTNILSYTDFDQIGEYAIPALQWAAGSGVVNGYAGGSLKPKGQATRVQVAAMLMRYMKEQQN